MFTNIFCTLYQVLVTNLIFYHDINIDKMTVDEINNMINAIGIENVELLFDLKRADLLAQSPEYHDLLVNINNQEQSIIKVKKLKHHKDGKQSFCFGKIVTTNNKIDYISHKTFKNK